MASGKMGSGRYRLLRHVVMALLPMAMLALAGCAPLSRNKARVPASRPSSGAQRPSMVTTRINPPSLATIVNDKIQHGHYAESETALRAYLVVHPGDRSAQAMLHQLTVDPVQMLGAGARDYTVKSGDSYSSLAARYLGDASLFVVLARYNGSDNPSDLRVGQTLRLPRSPPGSDEVADGVVAEASPRRETDSPRAPVIDASPAQKAARLQNESVAMFKQGSKAQALKRLDQALLIQPQLKSNGAIATSLRQQLVANYHEQAVVLFRDQKLDPAIALWDRVLAIDPGFEPAIIYRTRALELKKRLKQF